MFKHPEPVRVSSDCFNSCWSPPKTPDRIKGELAGANHPDQLLVDSFFPEAFKGVLYQNIELGTWTIEVYLQGRYVGGLQFDIRLELHRDIERQAVVSSIQEHIQKKCNILLNAEKTN